MFDIFVLTYLLDSTIYRSVMAKHPHPAAATATGLVPNAF
jgi:hypothetical protein